MIRPIVRTTALAVPRKLGPKKFYSSNVNGDGPKASVKTRAATMLKYIW